jgi:putative transposase
VSGTRYRVFETTYPYFLTCSVVGWLPVFARPACAEIVLNSWRFLQDAGRLTVFGYVILENHLHFVACGERLAEEVGDFKSFTARRIIDWLRSRGEQALLGQLARENAAYKTDRPYQLWQEGNHPKQIVGEEMMVQKLEYIHYNPVRRGYVDDPTHWRYSSARDYAGMPGLLPVATDWR